MTLLVEPLKNKNEWTEFTESFEDASFFHSVEWKELLQRNFRLEPLYLVAKNEAGKVVGVCPGFVAGSGMLKLYESIPYSDYGGPLCKSESVNYAFRNYLERYSMRTGLAYGKICLLENGNASAFKSRLSYVEKSKGVMEIDLKRTSSMDIWNAVFSRGVRKEIKQIEKSPFRAYLVTSIAELQKFYEIYRTNIKYIGAIPLSFSFIQTIWECHSPSNVRVWLMGEKQVVGGLFVLKDKKSSVTWLVGIDRRNAPNFSVFQYLIWKEISMSETEGLGKVSLGSTSSDPNKLHHRIKRKVGATFRQQELVWFPLSARGNVLLQVRGKTVNTWKNLRSYLPRIIKAPLENKLRTL